VLGAFSWRERVSASPESAFLAAKPSHFDNTVAYAHQWWRWILAAE
jgi:hypothetical protein